jgi:hypothetical protein
LPGWREQPDGSGFPARFGKGAAEREALLVRFFCDVFIDEPLAWTGDRRSYMRHVDERMKQLAAEGNFPTWE